MSDSNPVQEATGRTTRTILWSVVGIAAVSAFVAPMLQKFLPVSATVALIIAGAALAYFGRGVFRTMGQGAAYAGVATVALGFVGPFIKGVAPKRTATAAHRGLI